MPQLRWAAVVCIVVMCQFLTAGIVRAQEGAYRDSRTYVGFGLGVYTFHGPVDLWKPRSNANFVRKKDPAFLGNITFPVTENLLSLRSQIGYTSSDRQYGTRILISGENEFIVNDLMWFETELVLNLRSPKRRIIPYLFGGIGFLLADPFGRTNAHRDSIPVEHVKRTQLYFPIGIGVDLAVTRRVSLYLESGMRLSRNSIFLDRAEPDPFNSTLLLAGVRFALGTRPEEYVEIQRPQMCPMCPRPPDPFCCACAIQDLQPISFDTGSTTINEKARRDLKENVQALELAENADCKLLVSGYYHKRSENGYLGSRRASIVIAFYLDHGIAEDRFVSAPPTEGDSCGKKERGKGCTPDQRVETHPYCAFGPICPNPLPPKKYSPLQLK